LDHVGRDVQGIKIESCSILDLKEDVVREGGEIDIELAMGELVHFVIERLLFFK